MLSEAALRRAQAAIVRVVRMQPARTRNVLPFVVDDPDDLDLRHWIYERTSLIGPASRYEGPDHYAIHALLCDVKDEIRKAQRYFPYRRHENSKNELNNPLIGEISEEGSQESEDLPLSLPLQGSWVSEKMPYRGGFPGDEQVQIEYVAGLLALTAFDLVSAAPSRYRRRKTLSVLSCIARAVAAVHASNDPDLAAPLIAAIAAHPAFQLLPISSDRASSFVARLRRISHTGRLRDDLGNAGLPWATGSQWHDFKSVFEFRQAQAA